MRHPGLALLLLSMTYMGCMLIMGCTLVDEDEPFSLDLRNTPPLDCTNTHYVSNRPPLQPSPLVKLPIGSIKPQGWLRRQLKLERSGMVGRLTELSPWCQAEDSAWRSPDGEGKHPWEELPYWLKGFGDLGYVLGDERIIAEARAWIEAVLASQEEDGWFGPRANKTRLDGRPDMWPNMVMLNVLQSFHEATGDERVLPFMANYFRWQATVPDEDFLVPFWQQMRAGDNLESVYWLYNRTGEAWLLDVAEKIHRCCADWTSGIASWHGVNITQCFREPAVYYMQAGDPALLEAAEDNYYRVIGRYGEVPGGMFGADENCRQGYHGPRQAAETCSMVEFMHSFEMLLKITGDTVWAERCEEVAFNDFPASRTPDLKGLHYLTAPNMVLLDRENKSPGLQNGGCMLAYDPHRYRCCQHNVSHGWPYYAEELWLATLDNGLCASLYAASEVTARVGEGKEVTIREETDYPFSEEIRFTFEMEEAAAFPLYLRIPRWCWEWRFSLNGSRTGSVISPGAYAVFDRMWQPGDTLTLTLPMDLSIPGMRRDGSRSILLGPLWFSLKIGESWERNGGTDEWPAYDVKPTTPWNYGLVLNGIEAAESFEVVKKGEKGVLEPFTPEAAPIMLRAKAKRIPAWKIDHLGLVGPLQPSPVRSGEPLETVTLIPMGCARLRIAAFPVIGDGPEAHDWVEPPVPPLASHCGSGDTTLALNDGLLPESSGDHGLPRFTWWNRKGTTEWVAYRFDEPRTLSGSDVYWFDDEDQGGGCRAPLSWRLLYKDGDAWVPVKNRSGYDTVLNRFNKVTFDPITMKEIRLEAALKPGFSGGILEWRVNEK